MRALPAYLLPEKYRSSTIHAMGPPLSYRIQQSLGLFWHIFSALGLFNLVLLVPVVFGFLFYRTFKQQWPFRFSRQSHWRVIWLWAFGIPLVVSIWLLGLVLFTILSVWGVDA